MKKIILIVSAGLFGGHVFSQGIFYEGGWRTNDANPTTVLVIGSLATPKTFEITSTLLDHQDIRFQLTGDNTPISSSFLPEGSFAVLEAQKVLIQQLNTGGAFYRGNWKVINADIVPYKQLQWHYPKTGGRITLASFINPTEFVLSIFDPLNACTAAKMAVWIDGVQILTQFLTGSSVIGKGKKVEVELLNACPNNELYTGNLKYRTN